MACLPDLVVSHSMVTVLVPPTVRPPKVIRYGIESPSRNTDFEALRLPLTQPFSPAAPEQPFAGDDGAGSLAHWSMPADSAAMTASGVTSRPVPRNAAWTRMSRPLNRPPR